MNKLSANNVVLGCACAIGCEFLFGLSFLFSKQATEQATVLSLLGWRFTFALAAMGLLAALGAVKVHLGGGRLKPLIGTVLLCPVLYFIGETFGISMTTASESGTIIACIPVVSLAASAVVLRKNPTRRQVTGIVVTLVGVLATVLAAGAKASFSLPGYLMLTVAVVAYSLYAVRVEKAVEYTSAEVTFAQLIVGASAFVTLALAEAAVNGSVPELIALPFHNYGLLIAALYQGVGCSVAAFFLSNVAIAKVGVNRLSTFVGISTVVSIVAGIIVLGESFTFAQTVGAVVIILGVLVANTGSRSSE